MKKKKMLRKIHLFNYLLAAKGGITNWAPLFDSPDCKIPTKGVISQRSVKFARSKLFIID